MIIRLLRLIRLLGQPRLLLLIQQVQIQPLPIRHLHIPPLTALSPPTQVESPLNPVSGAAGVPGTPGLTSVDTALMAPARARTTSIARSPDAGPAALAPTLQSVHWASAPPPPNPPTPPPPPRPTTPPPPTPPPLGHRS